MSMNTLVFLAAVPAIRELLVSFLVGILVIAIIGGLIWAIDHYVHPIPPPIKMVLSIVLVICVLIWAVTTFLP